MNLGQEFDTYAAMLAEDKALLIEAASNLREISLGGVLIRTAPLSPFRTNAVKWRPWQVLAPLSRS